MNRSQMTNVLMETITKAMMYPKCKRCGCMYESLETALQELDRRGREDHPELSAALQDFQDQMEPVQYT